MGSKDWAVLVLMEVVVVAMAAMAVIMVCRDKMVIRDMVIILVHSMVAWAVYRVNPLMVRHILYQIPTQWWVQLFRLQSNKYNDTRIEANERRL